MKARAALSREWIQVQVGRFGLTHYPRVNWVKIEWEGLQERIEEAENAPERVVDELLETGFIEGA